MLLHRLRRAMVNPDRQRLNGEVEIAVARVGGHRAPAQRGAPGHDRHGSLVAIAVERHGGSLGRVRIEVVTEPTVPVLTDFALRSVDRDSVVYSDAWPSFTILPSYGYTHRPRSSRRSRASGAEPRVSVTGAQRVASGLNTWLRGTHQGVGADHLQAYLNEFVFRFNRRRSRSRGLLFYRLLELAITHEPVRYRELVANPEPKKTRPLPPSGRGSPPTLDRPAAGRPWRQSGPNLT